MYALHFHCPDGQIAKTFHRDLDEHGLACRNPSGQRIAVAIFRDAEELPPIVVARLWYGGYADVCREMEAA